MTVSTLAPPWYTPVLGGESESVSHSVASDSATSRTVGGQVPLSLRFPRQEYWSG